MEAFNTKLLFAPTDELVDARIQLLTPDLIISGMKNWWVDPSLNDPLPNPPIDRLWNWHELEIDLDGVMVDSRKVAVVTEDGAVQGAMMISTRAGPSITAAGPSLFVELLFTAPWNRTVLRRDRQPFFVGVGKILLAWGAAFSRQSGCDGRLRLEASPDSVKWYLNRGMRIVENIAPVRFEGVEYLTMELPTTAAKALIQSLTES
jgi:hypothetical protein